MQKVIHLGHNRSAREVIKCAIEENVQGIAISSYQGGHMEYFRYLIDLLKENDATHIRVFGGGGGTITPKEIEELHQYGVSFIFSADSGQKIGFQGMIDMVMKACDYNIIDDNTTLDIDRLDKKHISDLPTILSACQVSSFLPKINAKLQLLEDKNQDKSIPVVGFTGTGGSGKSSLIDELMRRFVYSFKNIHIALLCIDPTRSYTGGSLLGDRLRINQSFHSRVYMRSVATRKSGSIDKTIISNMIRILKKVGFDLIIVESQGIGQGDMEIIEYVNIPIYVMTSEYGAPTQLEKINMLDHARFIVLNKYEKQNSIDALRDIRKQIQRNRLDFDHPLEDMPVYPTQASLFGDEGTNVFFETLLKELKWSLPQQKAAYNQTQYSHMIISPKRSHYLGKIVDTIEKYGQITEQQKEIIRQWDTLSQSKAILEQSDQPISKDVLNIIDKQINKLKLDIHPNSIALLQQWQKHKQNYLINKCLPSKKSEQDSENQSLRFVSISGISIPRISLPNDNYKEQTFSFMRKENLPGYFPYTAGLFPLRNRAELPTRMFAGEGTPERTNRRFHYLTQNENVFRLSSAFDSVTLYGENPQLLPDIYGKIGNSGVNIAHLDDMKKLYSGFRLTSSNTSVSMTINGPAPIILAMFFNTAIDQEVEYHLHQIGQWEKTEQKIKAYFENLDVPKPVYNGKLPKNHNGFGLGLLGISGDRIISSETYQNIKMNVLNRIRGTVQADILKEDMAQNTCIFSLPFSIKLMGDVQEYFYKNNINKYYSISVSGYHIAEAGANPITQMALTLANGFTYIEYFLHRGLPIDSFCKNLSFFFSNALDVEYTVIGRVARRIWSIALKYLYGANDRSQMLKYHIQTSGRSLHAQEYQFNDIRTTLEALMAIYDQCNSLHTNAADEAITTPTETSVRRAMAIQHIINHELGSTKNENFYQGSYFLSELTDLVEKAILKEFRKIDYRGGIFGAIETMYPRAKIQDESMKYEMLKQSGKMPIIGVNTFIDDKNTNSFNDEVELIRSTEDEKKAQIHSLKLFQTINQTQTQKSLEQLSNESVHRSNLFEKLMDIVKVASLGEITNQLYCIGGCYRRNV